MVLCLNYDRSYFSKLIAFSAHKATVSLLLFGIYSLELVPNVLLFGNLRYLQSPHIIVLFSVISYKKVLRHFYRRLYLVNLVMVQNFDLAANNASVVEAQAQIPTTMKIYLIFVFKVTNFG